MGESGVYIINGPAYIVKFNLNGTIQWNKNYPDFG